MNETARYPSHFISNNQFGSSKGFSIMLASMGWILAGIRPFAAPCRSFTKEGTDEPALTGSSFLLSFFFTAAGVVSLSAFAVALFLFLSSLARLSASHSALALPRDAFLLLCHSAEA